MDAKIPRNIVVSQAGPISAKESAGRFARRLKKVRRFLYFYCLRILDRLVMVAYWSPTRGNDVLIVKLDAIGDFILWHHTAKAIRTLYPSETHRVVLLGNGLWCDLASEIGLWDEVWPLDRHRFLYDPRYRWSQMKKIRSSRFAIAIQPTYSREFLYGDAVIRITGARKRIGSVGDLANISVQQKAISDRWYTKLIPATPDTQWEGSRNIEFVRGLGLTQPTFEPARLTRRYEKQRSIGNSAPYYLLCPGAGLSGRRWNRSFFSRIAELIHDHTGWVGVICGSQGEKEICLDIVLQCKAPLRNLAGSTSLLEMYKLISDAMVVISNETSAVHIAAAVCRPAVCILGGGHYGRFLPYDSAQLPPGVQAPATVIHRMACFGCNWRCCYDVPVEAPLPCIENITVEQVWQSVRLILDDLVDPSYASNQ